MSMTLAQRIQELRSGFTPTFWIANTLELFERLAFYGMMAVLAVYLHDHVGIDDAGRITGDFSFYLYILPIFAGVIVDKFGFRKSLVACFGIFGIGYLLIGLAGMSWANSIVSPIGSRTFVLLSLGVTAIGGSLIKPCIVGTVAYTSKPEFRAQGYSIYYSLVNLGGSIGPFLALAVRINVGIEYVLITSSITSFLMMLGTFLFYKEPVIDDPATEKKTFKKVLSDAWLVLTNFRFISFLVIFSTFWIMFWNIFYLLPFYAKDVLGYEHFEVIETIDAICIIFLTIPVTALAKKLKPITAMIFGFILASLSWLVLGASITIPAAVIGIVIYAFGEALQSPRFYEYVSKLAPAGQVGTFMGFAFVPVALGAKGAGHLSDYLRVNFMETDPGMMWFIVAGVGGLGTLLMIVYDKFIAPKQVEQ